MTTDAPAPYPPVMATRTRTRTPPRPNPTPTPTQGQLDECRKFTSALMPTEGKSPGCMSMWNCRPFLQDSRFKSIYSTMYRHQSYKSTEQCEKKTNQIFLDEYMSSKRFVGKYPNGKPRRDGQMDERINYNNTHQYRWQLGASQLDIGAW